MDAKIVGQAIEQFLGQNVEETARETGFVQRTSKVTGLVFLKAMIFGCVEHPGISLSKIAQACLDIGVKVSSQGVDNRIDETSVEFLRQMFAKAMECFRHDQPLPFLVQFTRVLLLDSTQIALPACMAALFPGSGGNASEASLKIQLVFDFLLGNIEQLVLCSGRNSDQGYRGYWSTIIPGALVIMDLGYFVLDSFRAVIDAKAYFLSQYSTSTALYTTTGERIELGKWLAKKTETVIDLPILLGAKHRIPCRLIAIRLSQEAADRRRAKCIKNAKRQGRTPSQEHLNLQDWLLFVTNTAESVLSPEQVAQVYRVRWQIELVFKLWKSFCGLRTVADLRPDRILSELYARLIGIILTYFLIAPIRLPFGPTANREISPVQVRTILQRFARSFNQALLFPDTLHLLVGDFLTHVSEFGFKQKRKKSPNICHRLALLFHLFDVEPELDSDLFSLEPALA